MDGLAHSGGVGPLQDFGGKKVRVDPRIVNHLAEIEAQILSERTNPLDAFRSFDPKGVDPKVIAMLAEKAIEAATTMGTVTFTDINKWSDTKKGQVFTMWLSVRHNDPEYWTLERVEQVARDSANEEAVNKLLRSIELASGTSELGNSPSPESSDENGGQPNQPPENPSTGD